MNILDALRIWNDHFKNFIGGRNEFWKAAVLINELVAAYDALEPNWDEAPEWAQWCVINSDGSVKWFECEPIADNSAWIVYGKTRTNLSDLIEIPLGIDWRLCKWSRSEVSA